VDNVLSPGALERIRQALALSTVWCVCRERGGRVHGVYMQGGRADVCGVSGVCVGCFVFVSDAWLTGTQTGTRTCMQTVGKLRHARVG
jgi:hypothetical protein